MMKSRTFSLLKQAYWFIEGLEAAGLRNVKLIDMKYYPNGYLVEWKV